MKFHYSRHNLRGHEKTLQRLLEIIPGATSWFVLIGMLFLTFWEPLIAAVIIIAFDLYWLLRLLYMNLFLILSYGKLSVERKTDWLALAQGVDRLDNYPEELKHTKKKTDTKTRLALGNRIRELKALRKSGKPPCRFEDIYHVVVIPVARETRDIVEPGIVSIAEGKFPAKKILVVIALEGRAPEDVKDAVRQIQKKHERHFLALLVAVHPSDLRGEARVKGANATYAAKQATEYFQKKGIPFENVIASCFDADTVVSPDYFSCLTYHYMVTPKRLQSSFQPIPVYHNNIWQAPGFARVLDVGSSFFQLIEATNPAKLVTFSSHSMSFSALVNVGYWPVDMISDDSAIFWKAFIHFDGDYRVIPMYVTLSMDVTEAETWWKTIVNVYRQKRRWAWGAENFPIVIRAFMRSKKISIFKKIRDSYKLLDSLVSWATWPFLLTIIGWLPAIFAARGYDRTIFYYSSPRIAGIIFSLASLGLITCIFLSLLLLPKKKVKHSFIRKIGHALEWILVPIIGVFLSALPALDAQTRLMLGKHMEFWVTVKKR